MLRANGVPTTEGNWSETDARSLAVRMSAIASATFVLLLNAYDGPVEFTVPGGSWKQALSSDPRAGGGC